MSPEFRRALGFVRPYWPQLALVAGLGATSTALALYLPYLSKALVDRALIGRSLPDLYRVVGLFAAATIGSVALSVASGLVFTRASAAMLFDMRLAVYRHLQALSPRFYAARRLGDILARLNNDIGEIQRVTAETLLAWAGNVLFLVGSIAMLAWIDWRLCLLTLAVLPFGVWALAHYRREAAARIESMRRASAGIGSFLIETLQGVRLVASANAASREQARFRAKNDEFVHELMGLQRATYLSGGAPGLLLSLATAAVFLYGGTRVVNGSLTLGALVAFMAYQMRLFAPVQALLGLYGSLATVQVSLGRVYELLDTPAEVVEHPDAVALDCVSGEVGFDHVTVTLDRGDPVLRDVSFKVPARSTAAIVGASGTGKSTIADLLVRLIDPDSGVVRLDGADVGRVRLADLRRHVVLVEQEPFFFHTSIAENIRYASPEASDSEVEAAARAAGIHDFIAGLPLGYATVVGERGMALSAGERQRIAIARALVADPAVLVLDEPTAALDPATERQVLAGYEAAMRGRTTLVITHRLQLALETDLVIVLDRSGIVQQGPPRELLAADGPFAALFA